MNRTEYLEFVKKTFADMEALIRRKNTDYSQDADPFSNFRAAELYGVDPLVGLCVRMSDKMARIQSFCKSGNLLAESVDDAFRDLVGYSVLALGMLTEKEDQFLNELDHKTLNMIDESVRNADAGKVGGTFNPNVFEPDTDDIYEYRWWVQDTYYNCGHEATGYYTEEEAKLRFENTCSYHYCKIDDSKRLRTTQEPDEVWEWQWSIDRGNGWETTLVYYTDDEVLLLPGVIDKRKLISTGRRRT
jgi:hypothetical protein